MTLMLIADNDGALAGDGGGDGGGGDGGVEVVLADRLVLDRQCYGFGDCPLISLFTSTTTTLLTPWTPHTDTHRQDTQTQTQTHTQNATHRHQSPNTDKRHRSG